MKGSRKSMDSFFERYGRVIIVAVAICFVLLLFTPMKNKIGDNINGFVGNFANQTNKSLNEVRMPDELGTGDILEIEGKKYIVMSKKDKDTYLVISGENIGNMQYQENQDSSNVYEGSYIDEYLEMTYYNNLPEELKKAIVTTQIKQVSYTNIGANSKWRWLSNNANPVSPDGTSNWFYNEGTAENPKYVRYDKVTTPDGESGVYPLKYWTKKEKGYGGQSYNAITRHVYLPSIEEISNLVDLNDANKTYAFLKGTNNSLNHMWLRDDSSASPRVGLYLNYDIRSLGSDYVTGPWFGVRPAFVIDLSKIDYKVVDTVKYK